MESRVLMFIVLFQHGVTTENSDNRLFIFAHEMDDIILALPRHLQNLTENVLWKKGEEQIASSNGNGTLHHADPSYRETLNISCDGSLVLKSRSWQDGEEYSANITLRNNSQYCILYSVRVLKLKKIAYNKGPKIVHTTVEGTVTLPLDYDIDESDIEEIDWLTDQWNYFAVTKVGGSITILENDYLGCLGSSPNGSLIFQNVAKRHQRTFRACIYLRNGIISEQLFQIRMDDSMYSSHAADPPSRDTSRKEHLKSIFVVLVLATVLCFVVLILIIITRHVSACSTRQKKANKSPTTEKQDEMNEEECKLHEPQKLHDVCHV